MKQFISKKHKVNKSPGFVVRLSWTPNSAGLKQIITLSEFGFSTCYNGNITLISAVSIKLDEVCRAYIIGLTAISANLNFI